MGPSLCVPAKDGPRLVCSHTHVEHWIADVAPAEAAGVSLIQGLPDSSTEPATREYAMLRINGMTPNFRRALDLFMPDHLHYISVLRHKRVTPLVILEHSPEQPLRICSDDAECMNMPIVCYKEHLGPILAKLDGGFALNVNNKVSDPDMKHTIFFAIDSGVLSYKVLVLDLDLIGAFVNHMREHRALACKGNVAPRLLGCFKVEVETNSVASAICNNCVSHISGLTGPIADADTCFCNRCVLEYLNPGFQ